jgi:enterochelin esterase-like enzyme
MRLSVDVALWAVATFAGVSLAIVNLWRSRWWRKTIAGIAIPVLLIAGTLGINASFGLDPTVGAMFGVTTEKPIQLAAKPTAPPASSTTAPVSQPLWLSWQPPADMPKVGRAGAQVIPTPASGFHSRPAGIYLPPAALVPNPPTLPLVILMMGQPGNPDPQYVQRVLDPFAAAHHGLAPIVIVADQLGNPAIDPACSDSQKYGNAETFIARDVVAWARTHLNVSTSPKGWTIAGYSNGGACALTFAAKYPGIWGNLLDISGEEFPGADHEASALRDIFHGNQAAYNAQKPANILATTKLADTAGVFTVGSDDGVYVGHVKNSYELAKRANVTSTYYEVPNGGHVLGALLGGLAKGFEVLSPRLELSMPDSWAAPTPVKSGGHIGRTTLP